MCLNVHSVNIILIHFHKNVFLTMFLLCLRMMLMIMSVAS